MATMPVASTAATAAHKERMGWLVVAGGILLHLTLGTLYSFGNIQTYLVSYLRAHAPDR